MGASGSRRVAFILFGLFTFLAFPHEIPFAGVAGLPASFDLGLLFSWAVPAALVSAIRGLSPAQAARSAFAASVLAYACFFYWFLVVTLDYAGMPLALGVLAPLLPALFVAPFTALFAWGWARSARPTLGSVALLAALWVVLDWGRGHLLGGFPWATLGYGLHQDVPLLFYTRWGGVYVLSFLAVVVGLSLERAWHEGGRARRRDLPWILAGTAALHVVGAVQMNAAPAPTSSETVRVAAIQGNIEQGQKWEATRQERILATYLRLSERAAGQGADWIVWPETAVPGLVEGDSNLRLRLERFAEERAVSLVVGGMGVDVDPEARRFTDFYDSAFLFDPNGALRDRYDKTHLVPFGEFVPLRSLLGHFFESLATGLSSSDVTPGRRPRNLALLPSAGADRRVLVGVPICYELLFPGLVRHFAAEGAGVLLAITNDAWYGRSGAPHQFLAMTAIRAAENGLPTVRAANTGISAVIDSRGRVQQRSPLFEESIVIADVAVRAGAKPTFYSRRGDVFVGLCGLLWVGAGVRRRTRGGRDG